MSSDSYNKWWIKSKKTLEDLLVHDAKIQSTTKPTKSRNVANHIMGGLFARYSMVVKDLALCYDQTANVQKRFTMKKLIDAATIRLDELKNELIEINFSEYHYIDGNLIELKLVPYHVEMLNPSLMCDRPVEIQDFWNRIREGEAIYVKPPEPEELGEEEEEEEEAEEEEEEEQMFVFGNKRKKEKVQQPKYVPPVIVLSPEEIAAIKRQEEITAAILMIQNQERCRQERLYLLELEIRREIKKRGTENMPESAPLEIQELAATEIQRIFRGFKDRRFLKHRERERRLLIGMTEPSWRSRVEEEKLQQTIEDRRAFRDRRIREYIDTNLADKARILRCVAPGLMEDIGDEIREWFRYWYTEVKNFGQYPTEEEGGSILIVRCDVLTPKEWVDEMIKKSKEKPKSKAQLKAEAKKKKAAEKKAAAAAKKKEKEKLQKEAEAKRKKEEKGEFDWEIPPTQTSERFLEGFKEYDDIWIERPFEENKEEKLYMDMITEQNCYEVQLEVRPPVDEMMRIELNLLNEAMKKDIAKAKNKKYKEGKVKPPKKPKKGKGKKDPTGNRLTEDLFQELVDNGIIHTYVTRYLKEFKGDFSFQNYEKRLEDFDPPQTLGDIRRLVALNCILPMGVDTMVKPKSVLIAGHRQSGKHLLANAVFTETRCVLFDLSAPILAGKYPGKKGMKMLVHLINKMSRLLQPSVIFIDGAEKPFYKKVPKEEKELEPKKMGGQLFKGIVKTILPEDKVLVLGITNQPFAAKAAGLKKAFEKVKKVILIPRTDYGSVYLYWRELLMAYHGVDRDFNVSELAQMSRTYPLVAIKEAVETVLTPNRLIQLKFKPLDAHELLDAMIHGMPLVEDKEWSKIDKWYQSLPMCKKRAIFLAIAAKIREAEAKKQKK